MRLQADGAQLAEVAKLIASGKYRLNVAHRLPLDKASPRAPCACVLSMGGSAPVSCLRRALAGTA